MTEAPILPRRIAFLALALAIMGGLFWLAWAVLANRVHPTRHAETGIQPMRRAAGDAIIAAFDATIRTRGSA